MEKEKSLKEERIRKIVRFYYSKPEIRDVLLNFSKDREVVPRYFDGFGKRPDTLMYPSDIDGLVKKGATSFHASEEIWDNPLEISSEWSEREMGEARKSWDLVIDIDSKYFDLSKLLAILIVKALEEHGVKNYGIKFSGSKGWHIIVSGKSFPKVYKDVETREMFPEWPRAICEYLMSYVKKEYNKKAAVVMGGVETIKKHTKLDEKDFVSSSCPRCGNHVRKGKLILLKCHACNFTIKRKDMKVTKKKLMCPQDDCAGILEKEFEEDYFQCSSCNNVSSIDKRETSGRYKATFTREARDIEEFEEEIKGEVFGASDLVLVAPRHLFRMPYSLHEKTSLASIVVSKEEIENFNPGKDADPMNVSVRKFIPDGESEEATLLLSAALSWKSTRDKEEDIVRKKSYKSYEKINVKNVREDMFPKPIKKLLKGLDDGKKRGLFVLITFLRTLGFSAEYINEKAREWNKKNEKQLKEGYIRSQIDWHLRQKKQIMPPNYDNNNFYQDLGLLDGKPKDKNPITEVLRKARKEGDG